MNAPSPIPSPRHPLGFGELTPSFHCATTTNPRFHFDSVAGHWVVLMFVGSQMDSAAAAAHARVLARREVFDDREALFFGLSVDPDDREQRRLANALPGLRYFWDFDRAVSARLGVGYEDPGEGRVFLLDPMLRLVRAEPLAATDALLDELERRIAQDGDWWRGLNAPVLTVPRVFEPEFCRELIAYYERVGGSPSGFMREVGGKTMGHQDPSVKRRRDAVITEDALITGARERLRTRLLPMIERALGWKATRIERYIVACYSAADQGFFKAHRDNTTSGTAHRKFAVTINLNAEEFVGGGLRFPEFGARTYKPPTGGATVFNCQLLHEAQPVTLGRRYAFLPFLYDEDGARIRVANQGSLVTEPAS